MFEEVREMIDSTIYTNGRGEVTAQNVNLAMHGMVDATEEKFGEVEQTVEATNGKIVELEKQIEEGGLGGLEFSFPMILLEFLEIDPYGFIFDRVTAASITEEMPFLTEPIDKIFEKNVKAYEKYVAAVEKGEAPIVNIKLTDLTKELMEAEGIEGIEMQAYSVASLAGVESAEGIKYCMFLVNAGGMQMTMLIQQDGGCMMVEYLESLTVYIPVPGEEYDNVFTSFDYSDGDNHFKYRIPDGNNYKYETIFPVHIKRSELGQNALFRFVVGTDLIEGIINLESYRTTSRVIAKMTPEEVGEIAEGTLSRVNNLTYPYYEILPAEGNAVVSFNIKSTVPWTLYDGQTSLTSGEAGSKSHEYVVGANTLTEPLNHNYRLVATADGEELATLWIEQAAAAASETTEQVTEG
jgi:hypothetical protein